MHSTYARKLAIFMILSTLLYRPNSTVAEEFVDPPEDMTVMFGQTVTFTAAPKFPGLSFQWLRRWPDHEEILQNQTNSSLTIPNVTVCDVGLYLCAALKENEIQFTRAASLTGSSAPRAALQAGTAQKSFGFGEPSALEDSGGAFVIFAQPVSSSGTSGTCPGSYAGYVNYTKSVSQGWGWAPDTNTTTHTASDLNRSDTKVEYVGKLGDRGCDQTSVTIPDPTYSSKYRFTIYFPTNVPSTNAYAITLDGFNP